MQERELLDDVEDACLRVGIFAGGEAATRSDEVFEHHHIAVVVGIGEPHSRHAHRNLAGEVAVEARFGDTHAHRRHERALPVVERRQLHEDAGRNAGFAAQPEAGAPGRPRVVIHQLCAVDVQLQRTGEERRRQLVDVERQHARNTTPAASVDSVTGRRLNRQIVLAERPVGMVTESCFETVAREVPDLGDGDALLEIRYVGIDPTIRGWLDERGNYMAGVSIGEPVRSNGVGVVVETNNPDEYPLGAAFMHLTGWQQYCVVQANPFPPITMVPAGTDLIDVLSVLGHIGITAYVGVLEVAKPQPGETFCVSAAAGSVGSVAGQIAKMQGARVIGIAGSAEKCEWVTSELGFDACVDYKRDDVAARLKELAPQGVDIFFDNVGGELLDTVLRRIAMRARIVLCGDISTYNSGGRATPLHNIRYVMGKRARMEGFNTLDYWDQYAAAAAELARWVADGKLVHRAHVLDGLERAPEALVRLFSGDHLGKLVVRVSGEGGETSPAD
jgi:NADPH-dependent curcumin reductase CurA